MKKPPIRPPPVCWIAVTPDGDVLLDTIRPLKRDAIYAAVMSADPDAWTLPTWPRLRYKGWRVIRCLIKPW